MATTVVAGAAAIGAGLISPIGCVTGTDPFRALALPGFDELIFGGHDLVPGSLLERADQLAESGIIPDHLSDLIRKDLLAADEEIRPGVIGAGAGNQAEMVELLVDDLMAFRARKNLAQVIVVNVASTEPPVLAHPAHASLTALRSALKHEPVLPDSSLYACAAFLADCPFVDFTPSAGAFLPALGELARERGLPYAGRDGKTGETLVRSALAPMFADRALPVRSWSGTNLLGGGDGASLADPERASSKARSKGQVLAGILGYPVGGGVHIHNVPELGEWKTAWDHVSFEGFLGVRMSLQFTWQGCDSALAAPLVLDLARLMALAHGAGVQGPVPELAFFFKDPLGTREHRLEQQYVVLRDWACAL